MPNPDTDAVPPDTDAIPAGQEVPAVYVHCPDCAAEFMTRTGWTATHTDDGHTVAPPA